MFIKKKESFFTIIILSSIFFSCTKKAIPTVAVKPIFYSGADLSFLPEIEKAGIIFYNENLEAQDALTIFKNNGMNLVRVRLWHTPANEHSSLFEVEQFAKKIKDAGLSWWLDFHYADSWADPEKQPMPAAWSALNFTDLKDSVYAYTLFVMNDLKAKNILPKIVQIGNETSNGMLWDKGRVGGSFDNNWTNYAALTQKGIDGVKKVDTTIKIMLHFAGTIGASDFFTNIRTQGIEYDIMGLSYYNWWHHRNIMELKTDLNSLATSFNKDILIAETAYPFTLGYNDYTNNICGDTSKLLPNYPATQVGQLNFLTDLKAAIKSLPNNHGIGFCYWAPDWISFKGSTATDGSPWENLALFDFNNKATAAQKAFKQ